MSDARNINLVLLAMRLPAPQVVIEGVQALYCAEELAGLEPSGEVPPLYSELMVDIYGDQTLLRRLVANGLANHVYEPMNIAALHLAVLASAGQGFAKGFATWGACPPEKAIAAMQILADGGADKFVKGPDVNGKELFLPTRVREQLVPLTVATAVCAMYTQEEMAESLRASPPSTERIMDDILGGDCQLLLQLSAAGMSEHRFRPRPNFYGVRKGEEFGEPSNVTLLQLLVLAAPHCSEPNYQKVLTALKALAEAGVRS